MKRLVQQLLLGLTLGAAVACQENGQKPDQGETKKEAETQNEKKFPADTLQRNAQFLVDATGGNIAAIKLAQLALERSKNKEIRGIAKMLADDHTAAWNKLKTLASNKSVTIPEEETAAAKATWKELNDDTATEFDKEWCSQLMKQHEQTINDYELALTQVTDQDIKNWINTALPTIRTHYDKLMACNSRIPKK